VIAVRIPRGGFGQLFTVVYEAMVTNLLLVVGCLPVVAIGLSAGPRRGWLALALTAPLCAPAVTGAFAVFATVGDDGPGSPWRTFTTTWRRSFRTAAGLGVAGTLPLVVLGVDVAQVWGSRVGAVLIPVFVTLALMAVATVVTSLVLLAERPQARLRDLLWAGLFLSVRRWYLTAVSLGVLALLFTFATVRPVLALGMAAAPLLYVVWGNCRLVVRPALSVPPRPGTG
jgi:uncharacterized membrane protein YesL